MRDSSLSTPVSDKSACAHCARDAHLVPDPRVRCRSRASALHVSCAACGRERVRVARGFHVAQAAPSRPGRPVAARLDPRRAQPGRLASAHRAWPNAAAASDPHPVCAAASAHAQRDGTRRRWG